MTTFSVWAPIPQLVRLSIGDEVVAMNRESGGWWTTDVDVERGDADYGFLLDDDPTPLPDPRSRSQPSGVHERSRTYDPATFEWSDHEWSGRSLAGGVIYELHLGTFTAEGTLDAAIERLPHLVELGIDFIELLPVNAFNGTRNWGYDGVLWFAVDDTYGGPAAYQRFVDACHRCGLAVLQDVVYNHLGPSGDYLPRFGPYVRDADESPWGVSIDLDAEPVRRYILDNAAMWMRDYHVDGLRLDAIHALVDTSPTHILRELADETTHLSVQVGRPLTLIAESDLNDPTLITPAADGGYGIDAQWSDDFHHAVHVALTGETTGYYADFEGFAALAKVITKGFFLDGIYSSFRGRPHGTAIDTDATPTWRLVVANQTHDQVGNRATGDRLGATLDDGQLAIAAVLTLTAPFTPMLFMGEEWGATTPWQFFTGHPEPDLGRATAEGRIREFERMGWDANVVPDPQSDATFERSKLVWDELESPRGRTLFDLYCALIELRRERPELTDADFNRLNVDYDASALWIAIHRGEQIVIVVNLAPEPRALPYPGKLLISTDDTSTIDDEGIRLAPHSAAVIDRG